MKLVTLMRWVTVIWCACAAWFPVQRKLKKAKQRLSTVSIPNSTFKSCKCDVYQMHEVSEKKIDKLVLYWKQTVWILSKLIELAKTGRLHRNLLRNRFGERQNIKDEQAAVTKCTVVCYLLIIDSRWRHFRVDQVTTSNWTIVFSLIEWMAEWCTIEESKQLIVFAFWDS